MPRSYRSLSKSNSLEAFFLSCLRDTVRFCFVPCSEKKGHQAAETISGAMKAFGENDHYDTQPIMIRGDNEFSHIGTSFNHMAANTRDYIDRIKAYTELQNRQEYEFSVASEIQRGFLPEQYYTDTFSEINALMVPARNVGGDFYDYFEDAAIWCSLLRMYRGRASARYFHGERYQPDPGLCQTGHDAGRGAGSRESRAGTF